MFNANDDHRFPTPRQTRLLLLIGIPLAIAMGPRAVAWAVSLPKPNFASGDALSSADMNGNFKALADAVTKLETKKLVATNPANGKAISVWALYCGVTPSPLVGSTIGGYEAAAQRCRAAVGCQSSPSVHICTSEELFRSRSIGIEIPMAWYSTAANNKNFFNSAEYDLNDCSEWTKQRTNQLGPIWNNQGEPGPGYASCASSAVIACCD